MRADTTVFALSFVGKIWYDTLKGLTNKEDTHMPFCGNCGTKVEAGEKFCGNCGANIEEQLSAPAVYQAQAPVQNPVENMGSQPGQLEQDGLVLAAGNGAVSPAAKGAKKGLLLPFAQRCWLW